MPSVVVVGKGQLGQTFSLGFLKNHMTVIPLLRSDSPHDLFSRVPNPEFVLLTTGEADLGPAIKSLPPSWRDRLGLVQNELLPHHWQESHVISPTIIIVWFEKKSNRALRPLLPTVLYGPHATLVAKSLATLEVPTRIAQTELEALEALVAKNVYILTTNIAGIEVNDTVDELWTNHRHLAQSLMEETVKIQERQIQMALDHSKIFAQVREALAADPQHQCRGRTALDRMNRALETATLLHLDTPTISRIQKESRNSL